MLSAAAFRCCLCVSKHISDANCYSGLGNAYLCGRAVHSQDWILGCVMNSPGNGELPVYFALRVDHGISYILHYLMW